MKMDDIQRLLQKYHDGTLPPGEQAELDRLTHKDEVLGEAFHKADGIVRRRRVRYLAMAMTGLVLLGAGVWTVAGGQRSADSGLAAVQETVAQEPPAPPETTQPTIATETPATQEPVLVAAAKPAAVAGRKKPRAGKATPATIHRTPITDHQPKGTEKTVVVCNTQCEADSVINNIWKFLSA